MLQAEAALLLLLRRSVEPARNASNLNAAASDLQWRLTQVYLHGRRNTARIAARETATEVVSLAARDLGPYRTAATVAGADVPSITYAGRVANAADDAASEIAALTADYAEIDAAHTATGMDSWRARRAANGYANHWLEDALRAGPGDATAAQEWRLRMGAATESADAWAAAREDVLIDFAARNPRMVPLLFRVWDATMDRRTCPTCERAHGTVVRVDEPFPEGRPGGVHPNCRCTEQILTYDEVDLDYYGGEFAA